MKHFARFLSVVLCAVPFGVANAVVSQTAGNNLTAYNGESGATNNNRWNTMMNSRSGGAENVATADFGNCNAIVLRCAQPKCSGGGCTDLNVTYSIVSGCVQSNASCKQYGDELTQYIAAQLVAQSTAKATEAASAAQAAATNAAAQQSAQQLQQMQAQMQQMQSQMAAQNAQTVAQLQSALEQQKQLTAEAFAQATAAQQASVQVPQQTVANTLNDSQIAAAQSGVSADVLAREQISGQVMSAIESSEKQLKSLKATMNDVFDYAHCDSRGNNCTGPKRVSVFKQKANGFFDPYESVLDEMYDALILAQSVGVDITDIYMMLNGTCNAWAQYVCLPGQTMHYNAYNCVGGLSNTSTQYLSIKSGEPCKIGQVIPMSNGGCQMVKMLTNNEEVEREWLYAEKGTDGNEIRVGCASEALENSAFFRNRKKQASIDIETLQRIITQDPSQTTAPGDAIQYCGIPETGSTGMEDLQKAAELKTLPKTVCVSARGGATKQDCETADYISPVLGLCSVHVYNIGKTENPKTTADKQRMQDVIALKSTIMTQQLYKQYEYLESMIKRFKTQLEKAVLTTKLNVAGADSESSSSAGNSFKSSDRNIFIAGVSNCNNELTNLKVFECLNTNLNSIYNASNNGQNMTIELRKQLANDYAVALRASGKTETQVKSDTCTTYQNISQRNTFQSCLDGLRASIRTGYENASSRQNMQNRNMNMGFGS